MTDTHTDHGVGKARVYTYFIQAAHGGPVKIGIAADPKARAAYLQCGNPDELRVVGKVVGDGERVFHKLWKAQRIRGEWFKPHASMREWAPAIRLDDERPPLDQLTVERDAYMEGWMRALEHAAEVIPECRNAAFQLADDAHLARSLRFRFPETSEKMFAPRSHCQSDGAPGEG